MRVALKFAYDGRLYHGYARQPSFNTVEGTLISVLMKQGFIENVKDAMFHSASRTDKGVSSLGSVVAFNTTGDFSKFITECNMELEKIVIYGSKVVPDEFYPRYAKQRIYEYYLPNKGIDKETIDSIASLFIGEHDFTNFARIEPQKNPVRTIDNISVNETNSFFIISFYAQTYVWHQIRRIISTIERYNQNKISKKDIHNALTHPKEKVDFGLSSSQYLILKEILYDFSFDIHIEEVKKRDELEKELIKDFKYLSLKTASKTTEKNKQPIKQV